MSFGSLIIYDLKHCLNTNYLCDKKMLQYMIDELVIKIMGMKKVGETVFEYFEPNEFNIKHGLVGFSITQIISMSSITIHICEGSNDVYIDIFTCCKINEEIINKIKSLINGIFNPNSYKFQIISR